MQIPFLRWSGEWRPVGSDLGPGVIKALATPRDELVQLKATRRSAVVNDNARQTAGRPSRRTLLGLTRRLVGVGDFNDRSAQVVFLPSKHKLSFLQCLA